MQISRSLPPGLAILACLGLSLVWPSTSNAWLGDRGLGLRLPTGLHQDEGAIVPPGGYRLDRTYQSDPAVPLGVLEDPAGIDVGSDGTVFVVDRELHRAQRFTPDGVPLMAYGSPGDGPGELFYPSGVGVDIARDRVYVGDTDNNRVAVFQLDGTFVTNWSGVEGPEAISVSPSGKVFIAEGAKGQVSIREPDGSGADFVIVGRFLSRRPGIASGIAAGPDGNLYVAAILGVQKYSPTGENLGAGAPGLYAGGAPLTRDVTFDDKGRIWVLEEQHLSFEGNGGLARKAVIGENVRAIAAGKNGTIYGILPRSKDLPAGVVFWKFEGGRKIEVRRWGVPQTVLGWMKQPLRLSMGQGTDDLYVVDDLRRIQRFDLALTDAFGQVVLPGLVEAQSLPGADFLVVRTRYGSSADDPEDPDAAPPGKQLMRIERYPLDVPLDDTSPMGADLSSSWSIPTEDDITARDASRVMGVAFDPGTGLSWVIDDGKQQLRGIDGQGKIVADVSLPDLNAGFPAWADVAVDPQGRVYALHTAAQRLYRYLPDGSLDTILDTPEWAWRVDIGTDGSIFLPTARRWVWRLAPDAKVLAYWPLPEPAFGDPQPPSDVAVSPAGEVFVLDQTSSAIYAFAEDRGTDPGAAPPAPGRLGCDFAFETVAEPREVDIDAPSKVTIGLTGSCTAHSRTGHRPEVVLREGIVSLDLPEGVELIPGSTRPPATVEGRRLSWELELLGEEGVELSYIVTARRAGRWSVLENARLRSLDGWFNFGETDIPEAIFFTLLPPTPTPTPKRTATEAPSGRIHLPWAGAGED